MTKFYVVVNEANRAISSHSTFDLANEEVEPDCGERIVSTVIDPEYGDDVTNDLTELDTEGSL